MRITNKEKFLKGSIFFVLIMVLFSSYDIKCNKNVVASKENPYVVVASKENSDKNKIGDKILHEDEDKEIEEGDEENLNYIDNIIFNKKLIVIDAGHGGKDKGTIMGSLYEKDINLKISKYTKNYLEYAGYKVLMTRNEDKFIPLREIGNIVNKEKPEIFVSIHVNSFKESKYKGISTYYYDYKGYQRDERIKLAKTIQNSNAKSGLWYDRGIYRQNIAVLRYSKSPCVLVECGFITNPDDRDKLNKDKALKITAKNIALGIIEYCNR
ncbi:N-acetylmuramoyl-L-alanine amidase family protein [Clostridium rectalis]|uniref:N-acetylmuramoyl-L-alanine amidase family protein n=1 Tax=Clostridium rectalis TaxID=2040295 RepID=UPI000F63B8F2|nr:N-acetylmuramoyl-L-alanine amidase [Clostridium rectalis]